MKIKAYNKHQEFPVFKPTLNNSEVMIGEDEEARREFLCKEFNGERKLNKTPLKQ